MPTFGPYETAERLFLSGVGGIYALKSDSGKVIKILHPPVGIWTDDRIQEEIDAFRLRAKTQKKLAEKSKNWAPVHQSAAIRDTVGGEDGPGAGGEGSHVDSSTGETSGRPVANGAYAVMDRYERSVQSLLDGRVTIHNADLRAIFSGAIQGLIDLRKVADRPHGALKATNILLKNSTDLPAATVHLTDPAPDGALTPKSAAQDLDDLARTLYFLVNRRPYDEGTIGRNKAWDAIGPNGEDWRKLCDVLMNAHADAQERDLEKILPRIATWTAKPRQSKAPLIAVVVLVLLIGGGVGAYFKLKGPPFKAENWQEEALTYRAWYGQFVDEIGKNAGDPSLKEFAEAAGNSEDYTPDKIAAHRGEDYDPWIAAPNDSVMKKPGPANTEAGLKLIHGIDDKFQNWPVLKDIDETANDFEKRGWKSAADSLRVISKAARPPVLGGGEIDVRLKQAKELSDKNQGVLLVRAMKDALATETAVKDIKTLWNGINAQINSLHTDATIPLLTKLPEFIQGIPNSGAPGEAGAAPGGDASAGRAPRELSDLQASLKDADRFVKELTKALARPKGEIDYAAMAGDPRAADNVEPSIKAYQDLAAAISDYVILKDDPRKGFAANWAKLRDGSMKDSIDLLNNVLKDKATPPALAQKISDQLKELGDDSARIKASIDEADQLKPIARDEGKIREILGTAQVMLADKADKSGLVQRAISYADPYRQTPQEFIDQQDNYAKTMHMDAPKLVSDRWVKAHNSYLAELKSNPKPLADYTVRSAAKEKFAAIEAAYKTIPSALPQRELPNVPATPWASAIAKHVSLDLHDSALVDIMNELEKHLTGGVPDPANPAYRQFVKEKLDAYNARCVDAEQLIADFTTLGSDLDNLQLLANEPAGGTNWSKLYDQWMNPRKPLVDDAVMAQLTPFVARVTNLRNISSETSYVKLLDEAKDKDAAPELALTAWRQLGSASPAAGAPVLKNELDAETAVKARIGAVAGLPPAHRASLLAEVDAAKPLRWHKWADRVTSPADIAVAVEMAEPMGVAFKRDADPEWYYYQQLLGLQKKLASGASEAELKGPARAFMNDVKGASGAAPLGNGIASMGAVASLLKEMGDALNEDQATAGSAKQGPELAGWKLEPVKDETVRIFDSPYGNEKLTFRKISLVEDTDNTQKIVYLCTTEMPVGVFVSVMNDHIAKSGGYQDITNSARWFALAANQVNPDRYYSRGPRVWMWDVNANKFAVNVRWIDTVNEYPAALGEAGLTPYPQGVDPGPPSGRYPMQYLSPWSAMFTANLLGCRLPTSLEWKKAYEEFEGKAGLPANVWNLRGTSASGPSWSAIQEYDKNVLYQTPGTYLKIYPAENAFLEDRGNMTQPQLVKLVREDAEPWTATALSQVDAIAAKRITPGAQPYAHNTLWFQTVDESAGTSELEMCHLVGNVAEYIFDGAGVTKPVTTPVDGQFPTTKGVETMISEAAAAARSHPGQTTLGVIGGSSLSPPETPYNKVQKVDLNSSRINYTDVGFRLAYTAPKKTIDQVLREAFDNGGLPGPAIKK